MIKLNFKEFVEKQPLGTNIPDALAINANIDKDTFKKAWKAVGPTPLSQIVVKTPKGLVKKIPMTPVTIDIDCETDDGNCSYANVDFVQNPAEYITIKGKNYSFPSDKHQKLKFLVKGGEKINKVAFGSLIPSLMQNPSATPAGAGTPPLGPLL